MLIGHSLQRGFLALQIDCPNPTIVSFTNGHSSCSKMCPNFSEVLFGFLVSSHLSRFGILKSISLKTYDIKYFAKGNKATRFYNFANAEIFYTNLIINCSLKIPISTGILAITCDNACQRKSLHRCQTQPACRESLFSVQLP